MSAVANSPAGMTREDFDVAIESVVGRIAALEESTSRGVDADIVTASEFRLFKWLGTFALATVVAGFGFLYEQVSDVRVGMERLHGEVVREIHGLRDTMHVEHASIRHEIDARHTSIREQMHVGHASIRHEIDARHTSIRDQMHAEHASIREDISGVRERIARVETHLQRGSANDE